MADYAGRKLGLPALTFNPATWGKAFRAQEPARRSVTVRTGDLISSLEAILPGDRSVFTRPSKHRMRNLFMLALALACLVLASREWHIWAWLNEIATIGFLITIALYLVSVHTVLNFSYR